MTWRKSSYSGNGGIGGGAGNCVEVDMDPKPIERGRYAVYETPDGGWVIARSGPICDRCQGCGCGEVADPIQVPGMIVSMAKAQGNGGGLMAKAKAVFGHG